MMRQGANENDRMNESVRERWIGKEKEKVKEKQNKHFTFNTRKIPSHYAVAGKIIRFNMTRFHVAHSHFLRPGDSRFVISFDYSSCSCTKTNESASCIFVHREAKRGFFFHLFFSFF